MLLEAVRQFFLQHGTAKKYGIGYSGGLDSHVLLSLCATLRSELSLNLVAIHINHNLSPHAKSWANHCRKICEEYGIEYQEQSIQLNLNAGDSLEEEARNQRYAIFANHLHQNDMLLTAHHQDDQAETVLLQLFRGAGPKGLAAMPALKSFGQAQHGRPLLSFSRDALQQYAKVHALEWIDDESNDNISFARNYLRHEILAPLKSRWPTIASSVTRSAMHCAEAQTIIEELAHELYAQVQGSRPHTLSVAKLLQQTEVKQRLILRHFMYVQHYPLPDTKKITAIQTDLLTAAPDRMPHVQWGDVILRRYRDDLFLMKKSLPQKSPHQLIWYLTQPLTLPDIGVLHHTNAVDEHIKNVVVRYREKGEVVELPKRGRHTLKNLFQEWGVLPWERDTAPLIFVDNILIAVVGYFLDENYQLSC